jgi:NTP pyrophosphatase (non-canonical NTP hydrolase)
MITHSELVANLVKPGGEILKTLTPEKCHLLHMVLGIAGEAGELVDAIKKHVIYDQDLDLDNVVEELGDLQFYMEGLCQGIDQPKEYCMTRNIHKLQKRYENGYSDKAAKDRVDKKE